MKGFIKEFSPITPLRDLSFLGEQTKLPLPLSAPFFSFLPYILASFKYLLNANLFLIVVFHLLSRVRLTLWDSIDCSMPGFPVLHCLSEFAQILVHWVGESICLILCLPFLLLPSTFPSIRIFSNDLALHIRWHKSWSLSISPSCDIQGWFPCFGASLVTQKCYIKQ